MNASSAGIFAVLIAKKLKIETKKSRSESMADDKTATEPVTIPVTHLITSKTNAVPDASFIAFLSVSISRLLNYNTYVIARNEAIYFFTFSGLLHYRSQ